MPTISWEEETRRRKAAIIIPDFASNNFDASLLSPFVDGSGGTHSFVNDPTGHGRGKVWKVNYDKPSAPGTTEDVNKSFDLNRLMALGESIFFRGSFYIDTPLLDPAIGRKLLYYKQVEDYGKYPSGPGGTSGRSVVVMYGPTLEVDVTYSPGIGNVLTPDDARVAVAIKTDMMSRRWYDLMIEQRMETTIGGFNGIFRVWLDGVMLFEDLNRTWSDSLWIGATQDQASSWGAAMQEVDIRFKRFWTGQQVNASLDYNEDRFWDNARFSSSIIAPYDTEGTTLPGALGGLFNDKFSTVSGTKLLAHTPDVGTSWIGAVTAGRDFIHLSGRIRADQGGYLRRIDRANKGTAWAANQEASADFVWLTYTADDNIGVGIRSPDAAIGGYHVTYETLNKLFRLKKVDSAGTETSLGTYSYVFKKKFERVNAKVKAVGTTITMEIDGKVVITVTDSTHASGSPNVNFVGSTTPAMGEGVQLDNFIAA